MTDRPIPFTSSMVQALLSGRKTQTRRVLKLPTKTHSGGPIYERPDMGGWAITTHGGEGVFAIGKDGRRYTPPERVGLWHQTTGTCVAAPFAVGDRLYVREDYYQRGHWQRVEGAQTKGGKQKWAFVPADNVILFEAPDSFRKGRHHHDPATIAWHKRLGRFMPRWASRLTLTVTDVRGERLQDISETDAIAEGLAPAPMANDMRWKITEDGAWLYDDPVKAYSSLWDSINGLGAWDANPWIVAVTFTVRKGNIDHDQ
jgi:hypothetical protein